VNGHRYPRPDLQRAACPSRPDLPWDSDKDGSRVERAVAVCWAECPVRAACLDEALLVETASTLHGIRGGLTADERRVMVAARCEAA
jgi:hypothetical protein